MVNNNGIPIEVKKPFELVQELKDENKIPSYEEFLKNYESDGSLNYEDEFGSYGNLGVKGTYYGPGFWDDFLRPVTSVALAVSYVTPLAVVTVPASIGAGVAGAAMALSDDKDVKNVGCQMLGVVGEAAVNHVCAGSASYTDTADTAKILVNYVLKK